VLEPRAPQARLARRQSPRLLTTTAIITGQSPALSTSVLRGFRF
jgi:hypothetical protein